MDRGRTAFVLPVCIYRRKRAACRSYHRLRPILKDIGGTLAIEKRMRLKQPKDLTPPALILRQDFEQFPHLRHNATGPLIELKRGVLIFVSIHAPSNSPLRLRRLAVLLAPGAERLPPCCRYTASALSQCASLSSCARRCRAASRADITDELGPAGESSHD